MLESKLTFLRLFFDEIFQFFAPNVKTHAASIQSHPPLQAGRRRQTSSQSAYEKFSIHVHLLYLPIVSDRGQNEHLSYTHFNNMMLRNF